MRSIAGRTTSQLWEENKRPVNKLNLLGRLDYHGKVVGPTGMAT